MSGTSCSVNCTPFDFSQPLNCRFTPIRRHLYLIHSDFERGFIKPETVAYADLVQCGAIAAAREKGVYRMEGKEYVVADGDVMLFKFNV